MQQETIREAVGLFPDMQHLQDAVRDLEGTAFPRQDISVLGNRAEIEQIFGEPTVNPDIAEDASQSPRQSPVRPEEKTIAASAVMGGGAYVGVIAMALAVPPLSAPAMLAAVALGAGTGAAVGRGVVKLLEEHFAKNVQEQVDKGGLLLWVRTPDEEKERLACDILTQHGASHVKIHEVA